MQRGGEDVFNLFLTSDPHTLPTGYVSLPYLTLSFSYQDCGRAAYEIKRSMIQPHEFLSARETLLAVTLRGGILRSLCH